LTGQLLPEILTDAFALGDRVDGEFGQEGRDRRRLDDGGPPVVALDENGRWWPLEEAWKRRATEARFEQRLQPVELYGAVVATALDRAARLDQRAGPLHGEELSEQIQRRGDADERRRFRQPAKQLGHPLEQGGIWLAQQAALEQ